MGNRTCTAEGGTLAQLLVHHTRDALLQLAIRRDLLFRGHLLVVRQLRVRGGRSAKSQRRPCLDVLEDGPCPSRVTSSLRRKRSSKDSRRPDRNPSDGRIPPMMSRSEGNRALPPSSSESELSQRARALPFSAAVGLLGSPCP